jgi:protocatechuate 3,4-dioxygenase beta subunit
VKHERKIAAAFVAVVAGMLWLRPGRIGPPKPAAPSVPPPRWTTSSARDAALAAPDFVATDARGELLVSGTVEDSGGGPVTGARVVATQGTIDGLARASTTTDDHGHYSLALRPGLYALVADADGYARKSRMLSLDADSTASFRLDPAAQLIGRVLTRAGEPVVGAKVRAVPVERTGYRRPAVETDDEGRFRLEAMAGEWRVEARQGPLVGSTGVVHVVPAAPVTDLEVRVDAAPAIFGRVLGADGRGAAGIGVVAEPRGSTGGANARTGEDGSFRIEGLVPGNYDLTASTWREGSVRAYGAAIVVDRDVRVELTLPVAAAIEGRVVDEAGAPVARARVAAVMGETTDARDLRRSSLAFSDETGRFAFPGIDPGRVSLRADRDGRVAAWGPDDLKAGQRAQVTLRLAP